MALKRRYNEVATFSMASMTDVIFLLLIFFMVTSTYVFPTSIKVNLPQSSEQTSVKPVTRVIIDENLNYSVSVGDETPVEISSQEELVSFLATAHAADAEQHIALYADENVPYREVVRVLNITANQGLKMVLATKPASASSADKVEPTK